MAFIRRKSTHFCTPPIMIVDPEDGIAVVDGSIGDLWRCDECDRLWQCRFTRAFPGRIWWNPSLFARFWFRNHGIEKKDAGLDILDKTATFYTTGCAPVPVDPWGSSEVLSNN